MQIEGRVVGGKLIIEVDVRKLQAQPPGPWTPRPGSKQEALLDLVRRKQGASLAEMLKATGWLECRGTLGRVCKKAGYSLTRRKEKGISRYYAKKE
jgi:hypothetical protein